MHRWTEISEVETIPPFFLNTLKFVLEPLHMICIRNLSRKTGLMNGTRGVVVRLLKHSVVVKVTCGPSAGKDIFVPRINLQNSGQTKDFLMGGKPKLIIKNVLGFNRRNGNPIHPSPVPPEAGVGDDDQQVAGSNLGAGWCHAPVLNVVLDMINHIQGLDGVFAHGQLYVAMSRVTSREGLRVAARVTAESDPVVNGVDNIVWVEVFR